MERFAGQADAILGAIGLPSIRHKDGTEISPHLRLRDRYGLYAGYAGQSLSMPATTGRA